MILHIYKLINLCNNSIQQSRRHQSKVEDREAPSSRNPRNSFVTTRDATAVINKSL